MKYNKMISPKKLILLVLVFALILSFVACGDGDEDSSADVSEQISQTVELTLEAAKELLARDKLVTDMFVNNSLCKKRLADYIGLDAHNEYSDYAKIQALLDETYTKTGGSIEAFLSYPNERLPSVKNENGKTNVFNHVGSSYTDFADPESVSVTDTDTETEKVITATTASGTELEFNAVYKNGKWLLEQGIYLLNPPLESEFGKTFSGSSLGSFTEFKGDVLVIELFVSDAESSFSDADEAAYHERIKAAFDFITAESQRYENEVNVTYDKGHFEHSDILGTRALDFDIVFAETGFGTLQRFAEENYDLSVYDSYMFVVCLNKEVECSYNLYMGTRETEVYFGERVIIGSNTASDEICVSALSLLGAYGYDEGICDEYTERLYRTYFENDIMTAKSISCSEISPVTAYICGMTDKLSPLYRVFYYE